MFDASSSHLVCHCSSTLVQTLLFRLKIFPTECQSDIWSSQLAIALSFASSQSNYFGESYSALKELQLGCWGIDFLIQETEFFSAIVILAMTSSFSALSDCIFGSSHSQKTLPAIALSPPMPDILALLVKISICSHSSPQNVTAVASLFRKM